MDVDIEFLTGSIRDELPYVGSDPARAARPRAAGGRRRAPVSAEFSRTATSARASRSIGATTAVVRGATVIPRGAADAGVLAPIPGSPLGVALSVAGNPRVRPDRRALRRRTCRARSGSRNRRGGRAADRLDRLPELRQPAQARAVRRAGRARSTASRAPPASWGCRSFRATSASTTNRRRVARCPHRRSWPASARSTTCRARRHARSQDVRVRACFGSAAANWRSAARCSAELLGIEGPLPEISYDAERAAIGIVAEAIASRRAAFVPGGRRRRHADRARSSGVRRAAAPAVRSAPSSISAIRCARPAALCARSPTNVGVDVTGALQSRHDDRRTGA